VYNHRPPGAPPAPCYRCLHPVPPARSHCAPCSDAGVLGPVTAVVGSLQACEAVKVILSERAPRKVGAGDGGDGGDSGGDSGGSPAPRRICPPQTLGGRLLTLGLWTGEVRVARLRSPDAGCTACGVDVARRLRVEDFCYSTFVGAGRGEDGAGGRAGLAPREVAALLTRTAPGAGSDRLPCDDVGCAGCGAATRRANGGLAGVVEAAARSGGTAVVDVRPQAQWATVRLAGSARVDLDDLDAAVAASTSCPAGRARAATTPLVVVCRRGRASRTALARLVAGGFARATELAGGLDAWRREMDPSFPDYG